MAGRNWLLVAGIGLPGVVLAVFFAYARVAQQVVTPPAYDLLYTHYDYRRSALASVELTFTVRNERLQVQATPLPQPVASRQLLYRWHHATGESELITVDLSQAPTEKAENVFVPALEGVRLSSAPQAPDGYAFNTASDSGPGLIGALFYRRNREVSVEQFGVAYRIQRPAGAPDYWTPQFLGWIVADE